MSKPHLYQSWGLSAWAVVWSETHKLSSHQADAEARQSESRQIQEGALAGRLGSRLLTQASHGWPD